jgi:hypothetical protein
VRIATVVDAMICMVTRRGEHISSMREEMESMHSEDVYTLFYERVRLIREYYRRFPSAAAVPSVAPAFQPAASTEGLADPEQQEQPSNTHC